VTKEDLISALFAAFATFSAFGAAIAGLLTAGGVVQTLASGWAQHGKLEALGKLEPKKQQRGLMLARLRFPAATVLAGFVISAVVLISGVGLVVSFLWLHGYANGSKLGWGWAYHSSIWLFLADIVLLTIATIAAIWAATLTGNKASSSADCASDLDDAVKAAIAKLNSR
jgi:hypothetical protein